MWNVAVVVDYFYCWYFERGNSDVWKKIMQMFKNGVV